MNICIEPLELFKETLTHILSDIYKKVTVNAVYNLDLVPCITDLDYKNNKCNI